MFVALRELRSARWRFALITGVVFLLALLVTGLSGLTSGLGLQNVSAVKALGGGSFAVAGGDGQDVDLDRSALTADQVAAVTAADPGATPVGIGRVTLTDASGRGTSVVALGVPGHVGDVTAPGAGQVLLSPGAERELGAGTASVGADGGSLAVAGTAPDLWHAHGPVVVTDLDTWHRLVPRGDAATVVALGSGSAPAVAGLTTVDTAGLLQAMPSYQAENGSLTLMSVMLMAISALVVGAFFTVWSIQRRRDVAVLKALGAATKVLVIDALGQAAIVLAVGVGLGVAVAGLGGLLVGDAVPYVVSASTTAVPAAILVALGLAGAAIALRPVVTADPTTALGALR